MGGIISAPGQPLAGKDIELLKGNIATSRLIGLGEEGHGYESINEMKTALALFLHDSIGFENLVYESPFVSAVVSYYKKDTLADRIRYTLYPFWTTPLAKRAFECFANDEPATGAMHVLGCDPQENTRFRMFSAYLISSGMIKHESGVLIRADSILEHCIGKSAAGVNILSDEEQELLKNIYESVDRELEGQSFEDAVKKKLLQRCITNRLWLCKYLGIKNIRQRMAMRDSLMAENVKWLYATVLLERKTITWAADLHVKKVGNDGKIQWMGEYLSAFYRDKYAAISISHKQRDKDVSFEAGSRKQKFDLFVFLNSKRKIEPRYWDIPDSD